MRWLRSPQSNPCATPTLLLRLLEAFRSVHLHQEPETQCPGRWRAATPRRYCQCFWAGVAFVSGADRSAPTKQIRRFRCVCPLSGTSEAVHSLHWASDIAVWLLHSGSWPASNRGRTRSRLDLPGSDIKQDINYSESTKWFLFSGRWCVVLQQDVTVRPELLCWREVRRLDWAQLNKPRSVGTRPCHCYKGGDTACPSSRGRRQVRALLDLFQGASVVFSCFFEPSLSLPFSFLGVFLADRPLPSPVGSGCGIEARAPFQQSLSAELHHHVHAHAHAHAHAPSPWPPSGVRKLRSISGEKAPCAPCWIMLALACSLQLSVPVASVIADRRRRNTVHAGRLGALWASAGGWSAVIKLVAGRRRV